jgi:carbon monoxide dehydrogenase subunit G
MSIRIEERFTVRAPVERVWAYLADPRQVVTCLPGAELTGVEDERNFLGRVKVKVGPVTASYNGKVQIIARDDAARTIQMVGEGRETAGSGSAKMTMTNSVVALPDGSSEVHVSADVDVVGKIVQFGRGMIESVNKQLFKQFVACVQSTLETKAPEPVAAPEPPVPAPTPQAPVAQATVAKPEPPPIAAAPAKPVSILPLVFRAIWDLISRLWRRAPAR